MPCLDISTNVSLDGVDVDSLFSELTGAVARIVGKPQNYVMVVVKESVAMTFGGSKEPAAMAEIAAMGSIPTVVKRELIATLGSILETRLCIPRTRFVLKLFPIISSTSKL